MSINEELNNIGKKKIYIFEKTPEHIGENKASFQISKHIIGKNITINNPVNGINARQAYIP